MPTDTEYLSMKTYLAYNVVSHLVQWLSCCLVTRVDAPFPSSGDPSELLVSTSQTLARGHTSTAKSEHCTQGFQCTVSCKYIYRSAVHSGYCRIQDGWLMVRMGSFTSGIASSSTTKLHGVNYNLLYFALRVFLFLVYLSIGLYFLF